MNKWIDNKLVKLTVEEQTIFDQKKQAYQDNLFNIELNGLREKRNILLSQTDWWGVSDNTMTAEQTQYRQDLRDITNGLTTVEQVKAVEFPEKP